MNGELPYRIKMNSWLPRLVGHDCITIRRTIYCRNENLPAQTRAHEYRHIEQQATLGFFRFLVRYFWQQIRHGYRENSFEKDAIEWAEMHYSDFSPHP